jgi:putative oxidoreductase
MNTGENATLLLGRILMCVIFVLGGWGKLIGAAATQAVFTRLGLPLVPAAWALAVVVELGGGLAVLFGLFTRPVAVVLAIWCVATALIAHTHFADRNMQIHFMKNIAMAGGFLYVAVFGGGAWSLDAAWRGRSRAPAPAE